MEFSTRLLVETVVEMELSKLFLGAMELSIFKSVVDEEEGLSRAGVVAFSINIEVEDDLLTRARFGVEREFCITVCVSLCYGNNESLHLQSVTTTLLVRYNDRFISTALP